MAVDWATTDCIEWEGWRHRQGYGRVKIGGKCHLVHRRCWELLRGPIPAGLDVRHKCDNPPCFNIEHLELGTHLQNMRDAVVRKRRKRKLTDAQVAYIRDAYAKGQLQRTIAARFGIRQDEVSRIVNHKAYRYEQE